MARKKKASNKQAEPTSDQLSADPKSEIPGSIEEGDNEEVPGSDDETAPRNEQAEAPSEEKGGEPAQEPAKEPMSSPARASRPREKTKGKGKPPTRYSKFANSKGES